MTTYLIFGGAGFVGSHLARLLVRQGKEVHIVVRETTSQHRLANIEGKFGLHCEDLEDVDALDRIFKDVRPEIVVHLASATRPVGNGEMFEDARCALNDVSNLLNVLSVAENATRPPALLVRAGTLAEYGRGPHPYREDQREEPITSYAAGMIAATHLGDVLQRELSFPIINTRLALVYGPGQSTQFLVPQLVENCLSGKTTRVRYPDERRDLIYIDDVTSALALLTDKPPVSHRTINIATGQAPTMREVAELVMQYTDAAESTVEFGSGTSPNGVSNLVGSPELMRELYGWQAQIGIREGVLRLIRLTNAEAFDRNGAVA
jgi:nucleoside-diphosphate-sugar epimerase